LYLECRDDYETSVAYIMTQKPKIENQLPIIGPLGVNYSGWEDADMYYKGAWMLHSMRNTINNASLWHSTIKSLYQEFELSQPSTRAIIDFMVTKTGYDLEPIFDLFLNYTTVPRLEYRISKEKGHRFLEYRWNTPVNAFNMAMKFKAGDQKFMLIYPTNEWQKTLLQEKSTSIEFADESFYFESVEVK
jgi:aminopeptidase N